VARRRPWQVLLAVLLALGLCVGVAGCGGDSTEEEDPNAVQDQDAKDAAPTGPLSPIPEAARFAGEIGRRTYPRAAAPETPPLLRWDFSGDDTYAYDLRMQNETDSQLPAGGRRQIKQLAEGTLLLRSQGDRTATLVLKVEKMKVDGVGPHQMPSRFPPMSVPGVREDGSMGTGTGPANLPLRDLFPLPAKPLRVGETVSRPASMPFNAMGSTLKVEGTSKVTLTGYVTIDGHKCARLDTDIDIAKVKAPETMKGTYKCVTRGKCVAYFDIEDRRFVSVELALSMGIHIEAPMPAANVKGAKMPKGMPDKFLMSMKMDSLATLTHNPRKADADY